MITVCSCRRASRLKEELTSAWERENKSACQYPSFGVAPAGTWRCNAESEKKRFDLSIFINWSFATECAISVLSFITLPSWPVVLENNSNNNTQHISGNMLHYITKTRATKAIEKAWASISISWIYLGNQEFHSGNSCKKKNGRDKQTTTYLIDPFPSPISVTLVSTYSVLPPDAVHARPITTPGGVIS